MLVVGGPAGSGKSTAFPIHDFGVDPFNVDDRAAVLNGGSYLNIPPEIRARAVRECEEFIEIHIRDGESFAVETTLRSDITFRQADSARANGFTVELIFVATDDVETNVERVIMRSQRGGHSATPERLREIYSASLRHFPRAIKELDRVDAFDNTAFSGRPRLVLVARRGRITYVTPHPPSWLKESLRGINLVQLSSPIGGEAVEPSSDEPESDGNL